MKENKSVDLTEGHMRLLSTVEGLLRADRPEEALALLTNDKARPSAALRMARSVCLLRVHRAEEALSLMSDMCFPKNAPVMPKETPLSWRVNFISALLILGRVQVAKAQMYHVKERDATAVRRLRAAIRSWQRGLPWWGRLLWPLGFYPDSAPRLGRTVGRLWMPSAKAPQRQLAA